MTSNRISWSDSALPSREECVFRYVLEVQAAQRPNALYMLFEDGTSWTYAETLKVTQRAAAGLASLGVKKDDVVLLWLPNCKDMLKAWFAANYLGATMVALNTAYRGRLLQHAVTLSDATVAVVHKDLMERLAGVDFGALNSVVVVGGESEISLPISLHQAIDILDSDLPLTDEDPDIKPWDTQFLLFTSGTTGPSKAVIIPYAQMHMTSMACFEKYFSPADRYLVNMPLFHGSGTNGVLGIMFMGGSGVLVPYFRTEQFWDTIRKYQVTSCTMIGAVANFVEQQFPSPQDSDNPLRFVYMLPLVSNPPAFAHRFGVDIVTMYSMSEISVPLVSEINPTRMESCGRLREGAKARIVDENDCEVPDGQIGELVLRAGRPWTITPGYYRMPEATAAAWRNGWFHTGDGFKRDTEGNYYFMDRMKDAIRRRGENVSSYEVEQEVISHPDIVEAAVIAARAELPEDEVMVVAVRRKGASVTERDLHEYLRGKMAHFMLPRFIRFVDALPKTPSFRIEKYVLRQQGVTSDTWDREKEGLVVKRDRIG